MTDRALDRWKYPPKYALTYYDMGATRQEFITFDEYKKALKEIDELKQDNKERGLENHQDIRLFKIEAEYIV